MKEIFGEECDFKRIKMFFVPVPKWGELFSDSTLANAIKQQAEEIILKELIYA